MCSAASGDGRNSNAGFFITGGGVEIIYLQMEIRFNGNQQLLEKDGVGGGQPSFIHLLWIRT